MDTSTKITANASRSGLSGVASLRKSEMTRMAIVERALDMAVRDGLEALTLGGVAEQMKMSKTGVFARFGSIQALQLDVLKQYRVRFLENVWLPGMEAPEGLPRMRALFGHWGWHVAAEQGSGCFYISCASEYDDRPGPIRDALLNDVLAWRAHLELCVQQAIDAGHLEHSQDVQQVVYEMVGLILVLHHDTRLMRNPRSIERTETAFARLLAAWQKVSAPAANVDPEPIGAARHFDRRIIRRE